MEKGTRIRVQKETLKFLYLLKIETEKPIYEIVNKIVKYVYENEDIRKRIIEILKENN